MGALAGVAVGRQRLETAEPGFNFRHRAFLPQADMHIGAEYLADDEIRRGGKRLVDDRHRIAAINIERPERRLVNLEAGAVARRYRHAAPVFLHPAPPSFA